MRHDLPRFETARAKSGARLLDLLRPGWANEVTPDQLDLGSCQACVLGQLFGEYTAGAEAVFAIRLKENAGSPYRARTEAAFEAGFCAPDPDNGLPFPPTHSGSYRVYYSNLTRAWKREIARRVQAVA